MIAHRRLRSALIAGVVALFALALAQDVEVGSRTFDIARNLRCPVCVSESVADSSAQIAQQMRSVIEEKVAAGETDQQIYEFFQARYGDWILLDPPKRGIHLLVWLLPVIVALVAVAVVVTFARRWLAASRVPVNATEDELERVRRLLADGGGLASTAGPDGRSGEG